jgi:hypothetical protein
MRRLTGYEPFRCLAFGSAAEYLLSPTISRGEAAIVPFAHLKKAIKIIPLVRLMVSAYYYFFYDRNSTKMRHCNNLPWDDGSRRSPQDDGSRWFPQDNGSRRSPRCPPSHPSMALPSHPAQAPAQTARPSGPSMHTTLMGRVSPLLHQPGSTTYSPPTSATMGGEYGPTAAPPMPSAQASSPDHLAKGLMAPSHATTEAATPSPSSAHPFLPTRSSPTHPLPTMGGSTASAACRALECSQWRLALAMSKYPGFADEHPWVMEAIDTVALELQCWY